MENWLDLCGTPASILTISIPYALSNRTKYQTWEVQYHSDTDVTGQLNKKPTQDIYMDFH